MINNDKWLDSLPNVNLKGKQKTLQIDHNRWIKTIPKKNTFNSVKKYTFATIIFVCGLLFVSVVKNQARNLEKEISYLTASISLIEFNLNQAILDNEVITSPENISKLAKEYLNDDLAYYKKSQIKNLNSDNEISKNIEKKNSTKTLKKLPTNVKIKVEKKIKKKKEELAKLQELYNNPKSIPREVRTKVAKEIKEKKFELKNLYESPQEILTFARIGKWGLVQVVKAFLGMPIIPGR